MPLYSNALGNLLSRAMLKYMGKTSYRPAGIFNRMNLFKPVFRWRYAVPPEKGGWLWWIGPFILGVAAAPNVDLDAFLLGSALLTAYLFRQPAVLLIRSLRNTKAETDRTAVAFWLLVYTCLGAVLSGFLLVRGNYWLIPLAVLGTLLLGWNLALLSSGKARRQVWLDESAAAFLALAAPAAYWAGNGTEGKVAGLVWLLSFLQSSGSIVHMLLRLDQRFLPERPKIYEAIRRAVIPLVHHCVNMTVVITLFFLGAVGSGSVLAMGITVAEGMWVCAFPLTKVTPRYLGFRQIAVTSAYFLLTASDFLLRRITT
jgi:hypothetical protein